MTHETKVTWVDDLKFDALQNGKTFRIDGNHDESASTGVRPKALILSSLAGCTGIDIVDLLKKMRVEFSEFSLDVKADLTEEHPKVYDKVYLTYYIRLQNAEDRDKMERAVSLSQDKYCGVSAMIRRFAELHVKVEYL
jgi:putative redox protein